MLPCHRQHILQKSSEHHNEMHAFGKDNLYEKSDYVELSDDNTYAEKTDNLANS